MRRIAPGAMGMAIVLLVGLAGGHAVRAQTVGVSGPLYTNSTGATVGSVTIAITGTTMQATISLQGLQNNTSYAICVTDPLTQQQIGACTPANMQLGATTIATISTDASGSASGTFTISRALAVAIVAVANSANPSDSAQATVNTGATSSSLCQIIPQPFGTIMTC